MDHRDDDLAGLSRIIGDRDMTLGMLFFTCRQTECARLAISMLRRGEGAELESNRAMIEQMFDKAADVRECMEAGRAKLAFDILEKAYLGKLERAIDELDAHLKRSNDMMRQLAAQSGAIHCLLNSS